MMLFKPPRIIQGGMGAGVSNWHLARAVSAMGQLGVVSGTALDQILARRLQAGDPGGDMRRALAHFPLRKTAGEILEKFYIPGGKAPNQRFRSTGMHAAGARHWPQALCIAGNFVEIFLAREGHSNPVGINYLEKIQAPHLPSLYGAMLAGVDVVIVGAGLPIQFPPAIELLAGHQSAVYNIDVAGTTGEEGEEARVMFDPRSFWDADMEALPPMKQPALLPIVSSNSLAAILHRRAAGKIGGFIVEGPCAGGHNAPPRGRLELSKDNEPVYGPRDEIKVAAIARLGLPFWLAGGYGSPEGLAEAESLSANGVQVGSAFALCTESGLQQTARRTLVRKVLDGTATVFTDALASPTGFPFKVAELKDTLSEALIYEQRKRVCDLGFLRKAYRREDGGIGYRCPAEPEAAYVAKGGRIEDTVGRKCLCNALMANIGMPQVTESGYERPLVTLGEDLDNVGIFCHEGSLDYTAADVIRVLLHDKRREG